jgi:Trk-type K+ transport system membrane component
MLRRITKELKEHSPFTALGALSGVVITLVIVLGNVPPYVSHAIFYTLHPLHVLLSALVTTAMYVRYRRAKIWVAILIGWTGAIGIATISDAMIPYLGGTLLRAEMEFQVPFIEKWWINLLALAGIAIGYWRQTTRIPHFGHVLLSTWASLFYIMTFGKADWIPLLPFIFLFLFLAVWLPCCTSDIVYPLLFVRKRPDLASAESQEIAD